jgi:excisionase family DNA binding protein
MNGKDTLTAGTPALSVLQVARRLLVSEGTVLRRIRSSDLAACRVGRQWRVFEQDLADYLERNSSRHVGAGTRPEGHAA